MELTDQQIETIRESHRRLLPEVERVSEMFYNDLFGREPELRNLFRDDVAAQGMRFMSAISVIVDNLDNMEKLNKEIDLLAEGHARFGLQPHSYREMEEALIDTFANALGQHFTNPVELAWRAAFSQISDAMIEKTQEKQDG